MDVSIDSELRVFNCEIEWLYFSRRMCQDFPSWHKRKGK